MDVRRFPRGQDALSENPAGSADPAQRAGREGGVCFFAPGFIAQAKKGGSRRHGANALDVDLQPADEERSRAARCARSEVHTSELQSLMRISYAVLCCKKNIKAKKDKC